MGAIYVRPNGTYTAKIRRKGFPALSRTFKTRSEAETWMAAHEATIAARIAAVRAIEEHKRIASQCAPRYRLFGDLMIRYLEEVTPGKRAAADEAIRLRGLLGHSLASCPLEGLTASRIAEWRDERLKKVSGSTVNRDMNLLSHVIQVARGEWEVALVDNPFHRVRRPREGRPRERRISRSEEAALLKACVTTQNPYVRPIIILALETAMRRGEIVGLEWERVFLAELSVQLTQTKTAIPRGVALSSRAVATLEALRPNTPNCGELKGPVFPGLTTNALKLAFRRVVKRAGITDLRFHDLRHEATSRLFEKQLAVMDVATITGHQDVRMLRRYTHLQVRDLAKKLG
ncbi:site-specific integrase [Paraburkholderia sp. MMS20-SJTN17]|uniref:Site-specific integrase n=1 Tax=Paraburkholderia translucens TaxID=2886945 RepID=A0ABS8KKC8_9BURK|nr:site-specific integrase [Paraburkholderia sp. MMS20-SJTN17]MCC8405225.1 site-specific integrase [Paraburkholderia sp. MMS20-SJTN17]